MDYRFTRTYRGPLQAAILDWAGTTVDFGSFAPTAVFLKLFENQGVPIEIEHARAPMGLMKKDHLRAIAFHVEVRRRWLEKHGRPVDETDVDAMFAQFVPMQMACLQEYAGVIPGVPEAIAAMRTAGLKIGSTTGYTREMMEILVPAAARNGYSPDSWISATDVPAGRPYPWMCYLNAMRLNVFPMEAVVKIGDTLADIEEGLNAGMWTVGLALSGNLLGLTQPEMQALSPDELARRRAAIRAQFFQAGAHYVVDGLWDCPPLLAEINARLARGEKP